jgi:hypothetical protein
MDRWLQGRAAILIGVHRRFPQLIAAAPALPARDALCSDLLQGIAFDELHVSSFVVIPAKAGIQGFKTRHLPWIPAFAGMTVENEGIARTKGDARGTSCA